jgi:nucleotide-binding universal stress UspA family protein
LNDRIANYVVAYEATERGRDAIELGVALARLTGAELRLCIVFPTPPTVPADELADGAAEDPAGGADFESLLVDQAELWLAEAASLVPADLISTTHTIWADSTFEGLIDAATEFLSSRIIVGAGRGGILNRYTIGSVANSLLHASPVPVGLAPHGFRAVGPISRITCAVGTGLGWPELLESTTVLMEGLTVDLRFVTLVEIDTAWDPAGLAAEITASEAHLAEVHSYFTSVSDAAVPVTTAVAIGATFEAATESLDWQEREIVVVGSSRLASPGKVFIGATASRMLDSLPVPLIIVPVEGLI